MGSSTGTSTTTIRSGTSGISIGDVAVNKTTNIGGVVASATDTVNIATNGTLSDAISIGNTNAATTLALTGGTSWSLSSGGVLTLAGGASPDITTNLGNSLTIDSGTTGAINLGTSSNAKTIAIGNVTGATAVNINAGSGGGTFVSSNGLTLNPYGTSAGNTTEVRFAELAAGGASYVGFKSSDALSGNVIWVLPIADGSNGQVLTTDGLKNLSWSAPGACPTCFADGGNSFAADADLGTNDANLLNIRTNSLNRITILSGGNVGIGDETPAALLTVGSADKFQVDTSGNILKINNVTTSFPGSQGAASTVLTNDGAGNLTWSSPGAGSASLSSITAAGADASINNTNWNVDWNWSLTGATNGFEISEPGGAASSGTGYLLRAATISTSTAKPFSVGALGTTIFDTTAAGGLVLGDSATLNSPITIQSGTGAINIGTDAVAHTITLGNVTGATSLVLNAGTGAINIGTTAQARALNFGTGGAAQTVIVGSTNGTSSLALDAGTGALNIGTSIAKTITIGNTTGATAVNINSGSGGINFDGATTVTGSNTFTTGTGTSTFNSALLTLAGDSTVINMTGTGTLGINTTTNRAITTGTGLFTTGGGLTVNGAFSALGNFDTPKGTDFVTTGSTDDVSLGSASLFRYNGAGTATFLGIAGGTDGRFIRIMNVSASNLTIANNGSGTAANNVTTQTGSSIVLTQNESVGLQYDSTASVWRVVDLPSNATTLSGFAFVQGGNTFGATATLGTADANTMNLITGGNIRFSIANAVGSATLTGTGITTFSSTGSTTLSSAAASTLNVTSGTTGALTLDSGSTGDVNLGTGTDAKNISIGGTGANTIAVGNTQTAGSILLGNAMTTGTITIGGTGAQTGTITFGGGTGAQTVNLGTGGTGIKTIHIGDSAVANVITIGTSTSGATLALTGGATWSMTTGGALSTSGNIATTGTGNITSAGNIVTSSQGVEFTESDSNPTCAAGDYRIYADTSETKLKKCVNGVVSDVQQIPDVNSFSDTTLAAAWTDADTNELWDDATRPNITPRSTASEILVMVTVRGSVATSGGGDTNNPVARIDREIGVTADCADTNNVGPTFGDLYLESGVAEPFGLSTVFVDAPGTASNVSYTVCSSADSGGISDTTTATRTEVTLFEVNDAADLAEVYPTNDANLQAGDVVILDNTLSAGIKKSEKAYDRNVLGVVSTKPALVIGGRGGEGVDGKPVALSGRVPVKVSTVNGAIRAGDLLTTSSIPGVAMKATKAGAVIGTAITDYEGIDTGIVTMFVKNGNSNGTSFADILPGLTEGNIGKALLSHMVDTNVVQPHPVDISEVVTDRIAAGVEVVTPTLTAKDVNLTGILTLFGEDGSEAVKIDSMGNATFLGTLRADKVYANQIVGLKVLTDKLDSLSQQVATVSGQNGQGLPEILGNFMELAGQVIFKAETWFKGSAKFFADVTFLGRPTFNKDTAGFAMVASGQNEVEVKFDREYANTPVVNTNVNLVGSVNINDVPGYAVYDLNSKGFKIKLSRNTGFDIQFSWIALSVKDANTSQGQVGGASTAPSATPVPTDVPAVTSSIEPTPISTPVPVVETTPTESPTPIPSPIP